MFLFSKKKESKKKKTINWRYAVADIRGINVTMLGS